MHIIYSYPWRIVFCLMEYAYGLHIYNEKIEIPKKIVSRVKKMLLKRVHIYYYPSIINFNMLGFRYILHCIPVYIATHRWLFYNIRWTCHVFFNKNTKFLFCIILRFLNFKLIFLLKSILEFLEILNL